MNMNMDIDTEMDTNTDINEGAVTDTNADMTWNRYVPSMSVSMFMFTLKLSLCKCSCSCSIHVYVHIHVWICHYFKKQHSGHEHGHRNGPLNWYWHWYWNAQTDKEQTRTIYMDHFIGQFTKLQEHSSRYILQNSKKLNFKPHFNLKINVLPLSWH